LSADDDTIVADGGAMLLTTMLLMMVEAAPQRTRLSWFEGTHDEEREQLRAPLFKNLIRLLPTCGTGS
jgi:hypothetical protein